MQKKQGRSYILLKEAFIATIILSLTLFLVSLLPLKNEFLGPVKQEFNDFDVYDLFYAGNGDAQQGVKDADIFIVQAGDTRTQIADQVNKLKSLQPAVIGIDLSFAEKKEPSTDSLLMASITTAPNVVPGYSIIAETDGVDVIKEHFLPGEFLQSNGGFINFSHVDSFSVIRNFGPFYVKGGKSYPAFSVRAAQIYSPKKFAALKARDNNIEPINYFGNIDYYNNYSAKEFDELYGTNQLGFLKGKIVLLGSFTKNDGSPKVMEDMRFSPLNERPEGKSFPDIYGVVIHANIISMILNGNSYITAPAEWVSYAISFALSFLLVYYMLHLHKKYSHPIHLRFLAIQILSVIIVIYLFLKLFDWFKLKVTLTPIVIIMVLSIEFFELYKILAIFLHKKIKYKTIFSGHKPHQHEEH